MHGHQDQLHHLQGDGQSCVTAAVNPNTCAIMVIMRLLNVIVLLPAGLEEAAAEEFLQAGMAQSHHKEKPRPKNGRPQLERGGSEQKVARCPYARQQRSSCAALCWNSSPSCSMLMSMGWCNRLAAFVILLRFSAWGAPRDLTNIGRACPPTLSEETSV